MSKNIHTRNCLTLEELRSYRSDELTDEQAHEMEMHMNDCDLCSDAAELDESALTKVAEVNRAVSARFSENKNRKYRLWAAMAAAIIVLFGSPYFFTSEKVQKEEMVKRLEESMPSIIAQIDSIKEATKPAITEIEEKQPEPLVVQVAEIDSAENVVYYDSVPEVSPVPTLAQASDEKPVESEEPVIESPEVEDVAQVEADTVEALPSLALGDRKESRRGREGMGFGSGTTDAEFPGGNTALQVFIDEASSDLPESDTGSVVVVFDVLTSGETKFIKAKKASQPALKAVAKSLVESMPKWSPAKNKGKKIASRQKLRLKL